MRSLILSYTGENKEVWEGEDINKILLCIIEIGVASQISVIVIGGGSK